MVEVQTLALPMAGGGRGVGARDALTVGEDEEGDEDVQQAERVVDRKSVV